MHQKITGLLCLAAMLISACTGDDEPGSRSVAVTEFDYHVSEYIMFQAQNRVYVTTTRPSGETVTTDVFRVELPGGTKTLIFSTEGAPHGFIVSDDETFISISVFTDSPTTGTETRLEVFDVSSGTKTVLTTIPAHILPHAFDPENKTLLYYMNDQNGNKLRKIDLATGTDDILSDDSETFFVDVNPVNNTILMVSDNHYYFTDWDGNTIGESVATGFSPRFFSPDGQKIIGHTGRLVIEDGEPVTYKDIVLYDIATREIKTITDGTGVYTAASISSDQQYILAEAPDLRKEFSYDLFVFNTVTLEKDQLMSTRGEEFGIGFFEDGRQVLFVATDDNWKILHRIKVN